MTFPNRLQQLADITGHMTPASLKAQLQRARIEGLPIPKIVAVHRGLGTEAELLRELAHVMADLGLPIVPGYHGMVV
jgi:hypothetical protein